MVISYVVLQALGLMMQELWVVTSYVVMQALGLMMQALGLMMQALDLFVVEGRVLVEHIYCMFPRCIQCLR